MSSLYRQFRNQAEIDAEYDVETAVPDFMVYARHYIEESRLARERLECILDVPYGPTRDETLDIFPAGPGAPVFVFIHGGGWRILSSKEFSCMALGMREMGITTVVVNYSLCPKVSIDEITRQARASVAWVLRRIDRHGGDPSRVVVGGHSAGGQLGAMCVQTDWKGEYGLPADPLAGAELVSGVFDIEPFRWSCHQPMLQINDGVVQRNSPQFHIGPSSTPLLVSWGGDETHEFVRQSETYLKAWQSAGNRAEGLSQPGRNHFDAIYGFEDARNPLAQWVRKTLRA